LAKGRKDGYEKATKRAIEMAVFNIPYICKFDNTPASLVGRVIPDDWKTIRPLLKDGDIGLDGKPIKITKESLEIYKDGVLDD
jgi:hypothetical protein